MKSDILNLNGEISWNMTIGIPAEMHIVVAGFSRENMKVQVQMNIKERENGRYMLLL